MKAISPIVFAALAVVLIAAGAVRGGSAASASTAEGTVQAFLSHIRMRDYDGAFSLIAASSNADRGAFTREWNGQDGSLKTFSALQDFETRVLHEDGNSAAVRANLRYTTAVGAFYETKDFTVVRDGNAWSLDYHVTALPSVPPQVITEDYLRWSVIHSGAGDDWGVQGVQAPRVRIISMNPVEKEGRLIIMGEVVNEDTVPGFVSINATLIGKNGETLGQESSFDQIEHTLLPKEVSPYRIDFPGIRMAEIKSVRMDPTSILVPASAEPTIGVMHQRIEKDARGRSVLMGELVNQSGQIVNIPQVLATYYDGSGKVIWVSDGYVDNALLPQTPVPFSVNLSDDVAPNVQSYRVIVNHYNIHEQS